MDKNVSASEKLRALDEAMTDRPWDASRVEPGTKEVGLVAQNIPGVVALRNALPLIADVVEKVEKLEDALWVIDPSGDLMNSLDDLRKHLEGDDPEWKQQEC